MRHAYVFLGLVCAPLLGACSFAALDLVGDMANAASFIPSRSGNSNAASPPEALLVSAGPDQVVTEGDMVKLISSADASIDSQDLVFDWEKRIGPKIAIDTSERGTASFVAPPVKNTRTLTIRLKARAENGDVYEDLVRVVVKRASVSDSLQ